MPETQTEQSPLSAPSTAEAWKKRAAHKVHLPSGSEVTIVLPNLPAMLKTGIIPNELLEVAVKSQTNQEVDAEQIKMLADFHRFLVAKTVAKPEVTEDDVDALPYEDVQMIVEFATRQRDTDALGHHIAGLEKTEEWRTFRNEQRELASLLGLSGGG